MFKNKIKLGFLFLFLGIECFGVQYGQWIDREVPQEILESFSDRRDLIQNKPKNLQYNLLTTNLKDCIYIANVDPDKKCREGYKCFRDIMRISKSSISKSTKLDAKTFKYNIVKYLTAWENLGFDITMEIPSELGSSVENPFKEGRLNKVLDDLKELFKDDDDKKNTYTIKQVTDYLKNCKGYFHTEFLMFFDCFYDQGKDIWDWSKAGDSFNVCSYYDMCRICESLLGEFCQQKSKTIDVVSYATYDYSSNRTQKDSSLHKYKLK